MKRSTVPTTANSTKPISTKRTSKRLAAPALPSTTNTPTSITVGPDLGDRHSHFCVLDAGGRPLEQGRVAMSRADPTAFFERFVSARLVMEVGGQSPWVSRLASATSSRQTAVGVPANLAQK